MKYLATLLIAFLAMINSAQSAKPAVNPATSPVATIEYATSSVINELKQIPSDQRNELAVQRLVENYILPAIDQQKIAKLALGKHWKKATREQKIAFIETFRDLQVRTYTGAFKAFYGP